MTLNVVQRDAPELCPAGGWIFSVDGSKQTRKYPGASQGQRTDKKEDYQSAGQDPAQHDGAQDLLLLVLFGTSHSGAGDHDQEKNFRQQADNAAARIRNY